MPISKEIVEADLRKNELNIRDALQVVPSITSIFAPSAGFVLGLVDTEADVGKKVRSQFRDKWSQFEYSENPERYDPSRFQSWTGDVKDIELLRRKELLQGKIVDKASEEEIKLREENRDFLDWIVDNAYKNTFVGGDRDVIIDNVNFAAQAIAIAKSVNSAVNEQRLRGGQALTDADLNTKVNPNNVIWDDQSKIFRWKDPSANTKLGSVLNEITTTPLDRINNIVYETAEPEKLLFKNIGDYSPNVRQPLIGFTSRESLTSALREGRASVANGIMRFVNANPVLKKGSGKIIQIYEGLSDSKIGKVIKKVPLKIDKGFEKLGKLKGRFEKSRVGRFVGKVVGSKARKKYQEKINKLLYV